MAAGPARKTGPLAREGAMIEGIERLGHDSFRVTGSATIYIDPWKLGRGAVPAELVLVTHEHSDHFSADDIDRVSGDDTIVVAPAEVTRQLKGGHVRTIAPGETLEVAGVRVSAVPAYNLNKVRDKATGAVFHPKADGKVGYVLEMDGRRIYHAGDTDNIPEMSDIDVDVALIPVSGTYVMTVDEAVEACSRLKAGTVIPMHYADIVGTDEDARLFSERCPLDVEVLELSRP
jgi:L-ascorbate metabolism protein UlaG (beta-lactamase superfamily)